MQNAWARILCRLLVALMVWTPMQLAHAGMLATDQAAAPSAQPDRAAVLAFLERGEVARELQSLGIDPVAAKARVGAMSDSEVRSLAGALQSAPAGGISGGAVLLLILIAAAAWWFWQR